MSLELVFDPCDHITLNDWVDTARDLFDRGYKEAGTQTCVQVLREDPYHLAAGTLLMSRGIERVAEIFFDHGAIGVIGEDFNVGKFSRAM